ncbi:hypothetical protein PVAND_006160 [Polypedilum vanderplanki]|uniref:Transmembrane inner ear expressed protein n=1 Tax=Polypedilum vanderplanki TaxID=319348 RepID=A0A9J6C2R4_POLVA|nr:hypothetical protein PVAND_006160 [Polypedilum vanderplanki]
MDGEDFALFTPNNTQWLEKPIGNGGMRLWHLLGIIFFSILGVVVLLCCCFRFRIPRTKQEIEADFNRRKIVKKFRKRIQKFENSEMDAEMNLRKALEKIRADFIKEAKNKSSEDGSSTSDNDESNYDDSKKGAKKKKSQSASKKDDQLIQTIYTGNFETKSTDTLEVGGKDY